MRQAGQAKKWKPGVELNGNSLVAQCGGMVPQFPSPQSWLPGSVKGIIVFFPGCVDL